MKMNKFFMLGLAGLAFAACSNEEEVVTNNVTNGAVSVKIVKPTTKTLSQGETVAVTGDITVTLSNGSTYNESITINTDALQSDTKLTFWNVESIDGMKLTAVINGGQASYEQVAITSSAPEPNASAFLWQLDPSVVPAYGETETFTLTGGSGIPNMNNDGVTEEGASSDDEGKVYDLYAATVTMAIPMARLEVGEISFEAPSGGTSVYATLKYTGSYLDHYATNGSKYTNGSFPAVTTGFGDYWFENGAGSGNAVSGLKYDAADHDFISTPIDEGGLFNFFAGNQNPQFKLYFRDGTLNPGATIGFPRYAMITQYLDTQGDPITMVNGHIYKIESATLSDDNLIPDEEGNTMYGVTVTVVEATWTVETINAEWAN